MFGDSGKRSTQLLLSMDLKRLLNLPVLTFLFSKTEVDVRTSDNNYSSLPAECLGVYQDLVKAAVLVASLTLQSYLYVSCCCGNQ